MFTKTTKPTDIKRKWFVVDAKDKVLGRLATDIARVLRGKHKPEYSPNIDTGDHVVVINAEHVKLTGDKETKKVYHHHTGWVGGVVSKTAAEVRDSKPEDLVYKAVWGMLPKGPLGRKMYGKLRVHAGESHPYEAQKPEALTF